MMMKFEPPKAPKAVLMLANCPLPAAERRMHCRPAVSGGRSVNSVEIVAPPFVWMFHPMSAPPGEYFRAMK